jgi:hypothetical protein
MADFPPSSDAHADAGGDARLGPGDESPERAPRWVRVSGIIAIVVVVLFVVLHVTGNSLGSH